jgi:hypothetical protein
VSNWLENYKVYCHSCDKDRPHRESWICGVCGLTFCEKCMVIYEVPWVSGIKGVNNTAIQYKRCKPCAAEKVLTK